MYCSLQVEINWEVSYQTSIIITLYVTWGSNDSLGYVVVF